MTIETIQDIRIKAETIENAEVVFKEAHARVDDRTECREAGVKFLFENVLDG